MAASRRDQLIDTALELFYRDGFHATGIDRILAESGAAKMTLYKHFKSKDALILAALQRSGERFRGWLMCAVERRAETPRDRLLAIFDVLDEWFGRQTFHGCVFVNASAEYAEPDSPIHRACAEHKAVMLNDICSLAAAAGAGDPQALAEQLALLLEGAISLAHVCGKRDAARTARRAAEVLIDHALGGTAKEAPPAAGWCRTE